MPNSYCSSRKHNLENHKLLTVKKNCFYPVKKINLPRKQKKTLSNFWVLTIVFINIFLVNEKPDYLKVENGFILAWRDKNGFYGFFVITI